MGDLVRTAKPCATEAALMARIGFLGSPAFTEPVLEALLEAGHEIALVVSRPDARRTRGGPATPTPVKAWAAARSIPTSDDPADLIAARVDLGVVVAYGAMIRPPLLGAVRLVNLHLSLLPRWRGAAPLERAILAGDERSGVCLMELDEGLDTGPVYSTAEVPISDQDYLEDLRAKLIGAGAALLVSALADGLGNMPEPQPQRGEATYAAKVTNEERHLDWSRPASELAAVVRVGRAWTTLGARRLIIHRARVASETELDAARAGYPGAISGTTVASGRGGLVLERVQSEGRAIQDADDWARGARLEPGAVLGT